MLTNLACKSSGSLIRAQLVMFRALGDQISLSGDDMRQALDLDVRGWTAWTDFLSDGGLPAEPPLPEMLRRLGKAAFHMAIMANADAIQA